MLVKDFGVPYISARQKYIIIMIIDTTALGCRRWFLAMYGVTVRIWS